MNARVKNFLSTSVLIRLLIGFLTVMIPLYSIGIGILWASSDMVKKNVQNSITDKMNFFMGYLDKELQSVSQMLVALNNDPDVPTYLLLQDEAFSYEKVQSEKNIRTKMNIIYYSSSYLNDVFLLLPKSGQQLSLLKGSSAIDTKGQAIIARIKNSKTRLDRYADNNGLTYTIVFPDVYRVNNQVDYVLGVDIDQNRIVDGLKTLQTDSNVNVFLVENENKRLVGSRSLTTLDSKIYQSLVGQNTLETINTITIDKERYLVQVNPSSDGVLLLVSYIKERDVLAPVAIFERLLWLFIAASLLFIFIYSLVLFRQIYKPLNTLVHYMMEVENGNMSIEIARKQGDEFGYVYKQFNKMVAQLRNLIEEVFQKKIQLQSSELKQLQSQINPHFLFNCFYIGYRMAKEGENENVANLLKYLGDYFRFITRQAQNMIPLEDEMRFVETYLEIQKIRFSNKLYYSIQKDPGVEGVLVPGLTIQPLVENSILYGIEQVDEPGYIEIKLRMMNGFVTVEVLDNGIGMSEEALYELRERLNSNEPDSEHCGLWNVNLRLRHNLKSQEGLLIESRENGGLKVSFKLPC